jgi:hypothetical protein
LFLFSWCLVVAISALSSLWWWFLVIRVLVNGAYNWFSNIFDSLIVFKFIEICRIICLWLTSIVVPTVFPRVMLCFF